MSAGRKLEDRVGMPTCTPSLVKSRGNWAAEMVAVAKTQWLEGKTAGQEAIPASKRALGRFNCRLCSMTTRVTASTAFKLTLTKAEKEII